jgi:hypothetical protein
MKKTAFLGSAAVVALSAGHALAATPSVMGHGTPHKVISNTPGLVTLYDQTSDELSGAIGSQNFGSPWTSYDDQGADDFVVPPGHRWIINEIDVPGVNYGSHAASSLNVIFYKNKRGWRQPGRVVAECDNRSSAGYNGNGGYAIKLKIKTCTSKPKLGAGHYWVSVVANQNFSTDSQWFWTLNGTIHNYAAMWQNQGTDEGGCNFWCDLYDVIGYSADLAFTLKGLSKSARR